METLAGIRITLTHTGQETLTIPTVSTTRMVVMEILTATNQLQTPYATQAPKLYDSQGNYRGKLSNNPYDPDSVSNPYGRYGNPYSPDSINNPYGAGNPYKSDSPNNPYGQGMTIIGE